MSKRTALIVIGTYKQDWFGLAPVAQAQFIERVGKIAEKAGVKPLTGYRLLSTQGAFLEVWEAEEPAAIEQMVKELQAMGYTRYVEARWLVGEREVETTGDGRPKTVAASAVPSRSRVAPRRTSIPSRRPK